MLSQSAMIPFSLVGCSDNLSPHLSCSTNALLWFLSARYDQTISSSNVKISMQIITIHMVNYCNTISLYLKGNLFFLFESDYVCNLCTSASMRLILGTRLWWTYNWLQGDCGFKCPLIKKCSWLLILWRRKMYKSPYHTHIMNEHNQWW